MGQVCRFVVIQRILMPAVIGTLLDLLGVMAVYPGLVQILHNIAQVFIQTVFRFGHLFPSFPC
jgi:hypothetical protein